MSFKNTHNRLNKSNYLLLIYFLLFFILVSGLRVSSPTIIVFIKIRFNDLQTSEEIFKVVNVNDTMPQHYNSLMW